MSTFLESLDPAQLPALLPVLLASRLSGTTPETMAALLDTWTPADHAEVLDALLVLGREHRVYDAHPLCRTLARGFMGSVFPDYSVSGADLLQRAQEDGPTVVICNHLSYIDAPGIDAVLAWSGFAPVADRIVHLAGPKVYQEPLRLLAAAAIHSLPVPQSTSLGHTEKLSRRELAERALASFAASDEALAQGRSVLFYPEGSRSRDGRLQSYLRATWRYLRHARFVVPAALTGTDLAMPLDDVGMRPSTISLAFAPAIDLQNIPPRDALERCHAATAALLPASRRPLPDTLPVR